MAVVEQLERPVRSHGDSVDLKSQTRGINLEIDVPGFLRFVRRNRSWISCASNARLTNPALRASRHKSGICMGSSAIVKRLLTRMRSCSATTAISAT
jgi:hypothetical protein